MTRIFRHDPIDFSAMPPAIRGLLIANVAGFVIAKLVGPQIDDLFGLVPQHLIFDRWVWQPVTYLFLHGSIWHLIFNMFALWMFGMPVEAQWGEAEFLKYYFLCGLGAALTSAAFGVHSSIPVIGASGPVYGLLVAFAMLYPDAVVYLYFLIPVKAAHMAILFGALEFFAGATGATPGIARFAHLGGMVTGYLYIRWWWVWKVKGKSLFKGIFQRDVEEVPARPQARRAARPAADAERRAPDPMAEVDRILDKILASGLESLSDEERALMKRYAEKEQALVRPKRFVVGLTGGIGTGKSSALAEFERAGAATVSLDRIAREQARPGRPGYRAIVKAFGRGALAPDGSVDRRALGARVFRDPAARARLERAVHPPILREMRRLVGRLTGVVVVDVPLLFEKRLQGLFDAALLVACPAAEQVRRVVRRDGLSPAEARRRIAAQWPSARKRALADLTLDNDGTPAALRAKTRAVYAGLALLHGGTPNGNPD